MNFDRFAERASRFVSRGVWFAICVLLVVAWIPTLFILSVDSSQLIINTATTILTFLMVAILENSTRRFEDATNRKLNVLAKSQAVMMEKMEIDEEHYPEELRAAEGSERPD